MEKIKKLNIFNMNHEEVKQAYVDAKSKLLELNLNSNKEHIGNFSHLKKTLRKNIARCLMILD